MQRNRGKQQNGEDSSKKISFFEDLFKKIRDTKGTFHAKMGSIKDKNRIELKEAEYIKMRWQEYTQEYT